MGKGGFKHLNLSFFLNIAIPLSLSLSPFLSGGAKALPEEGGNRYRPRTRKQAGSARLWFETGPLAGGLTDADALQRDQTGH